MNDKRLQKKIDDIEWILSEIVSEVETFESAIEEYKEQVKDLEEMLEEANYKLEAIKDL